MAHTEHAALWRGEGGVPHGAGVGEEEGAVTVETEAVRAVELHPLVVADQHLELRLVHRLRDDGLVREVSHEQSSCLIKCHGVWKSTCRAAFHKLPWSTVIARVYFHNFSRPRGNNMQCKVVALPGVVKRKS
eukprot:CAMPEP_0202837136 /NCGR_PEP_ID=MMETSP1389-20130828/44695_1 /ASSEMBLY_ACC=CAM_ASM_000865 /TAXON_ID=302021 /ORGANISM="Rhodomonas sp., Strain CCMP768" /LENGTH=131 /DNA_ID=CAMNT_0049513137 /DNA_START=262 /DNA_END=654 /DNA_ORIENTATION=+